MLVHPTHPILPVEEARNGSRLPLQRVAPAQRAGFLDVAQALHTLSRIIESHPKGHAMPAFPQNRLSRLVPLGVLAIFGALLSACGGIVVHTYSEPAPAPRYVYAQPGPAPAPVYSGPDLNAEVNSYEPAPQPGSEQPTYTADANAFADELQPMGVWVDIPEYHHCWRPRGVARDWRPYTVGHWVYTDYGWTWASDEAFGDICFHYGSWVEDPSNGWCWVPGRAWAPAWVAWRFGDEDCGWAPLPPRFCTGLRPITTVDVEVIPAAQFCFVPSNRLLEPRLDRQVLPRAQNVTIIRKTVNVTNISISNHMVVNKSVDVRRVESITHQKVQTVTVKKVTDPKEAQALRSKGQPVIYTPTARAAARPTDRNAPAPRAGTPAVTGQPAPTGQPPQRIQPQPQVTEQERLKQQQETERARQQTDAQRAKAAEAERTKATEAERAKATEAERARATEAERAKATEAERAKATEAEHAKPVEPDRARPAEPDRAKPAPDAERAAEDRAPKAQENK
jgi:hypothetical protein